jgi:hypothetical protein
MIDRDSAERLMINFMDINEALNAATITISHFPEQEEQRRFRRAVGEIGNIVYLDLMRPIIKQFPDLDPDK